MTDIVEQAARRLYESGAPFADSKYWAQRLADAGLLREPARTVPTRRQIADVLSDHWISDPSGGTSTGSWCDCTCGAHITTPGIRDIAARLGIVHQADAILALMDGQPTVAEVKAQALEEAADAFDALQTQMNEHPSRRDPAIWLIDRAQQVRDGK